MRRGGGRKCGYQSVITLDKTDGFIPLLCGERERERTGHAMSQWLCTMLVNVSTLQFPLKMA